MTKKIHIKDSLHPTLGKFVNRIADEGIPSDAVEIYRGRNRVVVCEIADFAEQPMRVNIKEFRVPHLLNRFIYSTFRKSKARRAFEHAVELHRLGITTPEPYAWIELRESFGLLGKSYFVSRQFDGWREIREAESRNLPDLDDVCLNLGKLLLKFHLLGIWMKDASPGNFLWRRNENGEIEFAVVDINRMAFGVSSYDKLMSNFGRLFEQPENILKTARGYAIAANVDEHTVIKKAREQIERAERLKKKKRRFKALLNKR